MMVISYIILGLAAGVLSGLLGIGGGVLIVPALVYLCGFTQLQAQGTTLALMVPPIGILAAMRYYQAGNVKLAAAVLICLGFVAGGYFGANMAQDIPHVVLKRSFGIFMLLVSLQMIFSK